MNIFEFIRSQRQSYETDTISLAGGAVEYSQYSTLKQIDAYLNDSYLDKGAAKDDVIGEYPFDNISTYRILLEARATDFDQKHIEVEPENNSKEARIAAIIGTKALTRYLPKIKFGEYANEFCYTRAAYGGAISTITKDGITVIPWQNAITDQSEIMSSPRIIRHTFSPSELLKQEGWENLEDALKTARRFRKEDASSDKDNKTSGELIEVFEVQGDIKDCVFKDAEARFKGEEYVYDDDDEYSYTEAKIIVVGADWQSKDAQTKQTQENGIILYVNAEKTSQRYLARNPFVGRGLGKGVVEDLFQHQKWHNFTKTEEMRRLAVGGKDLYITDDDDVLKNVHGRGADHGTVLKINPGRMFTKLNNLESTTPIYQPIRDDWDKSADNRTSSYNAVVGEETKSGVPYRAQYLQNQAGTGQFEQYREEIGMHFADIISKEILPDALADLAKEKELYEEFTSKELELIDEAIAIEERNKKAFEATLAGQVIGDTELDMFEAGVRESLARSGNKRTITDFKDYLKKVPKKVIIHTTDEMRSKAQLYESLSNLLGSMAPNDPRRESILEEIAMLIGRPMELYNAPGGALPQAPQPQAQPPAPIPNL